MTLKSEVGFAFCCEIPYFDCFIHGCRAEFGEILGIEGEGHDEMFMFVESSDKREVFFVVPDFDFGIIG